MADTASGNNWKLGIPVCPTDLVHLSTQSKVPAMAVTQAHGGNYGTLKPLASVH